MPKRIHIKKAAYHITTNCQSRFPYFEEDIFCNILIDSLANCQKIKPFVLIGFKINPDHSHIILQSTGDFNISQIMQNVKRTSSTQINQIIHYQYETNPYVKLEWTNRLKQYNRMFQRKNNFGIHEFPMFKWQVSFDDQIIRYPSQLTDTIAYLRKQHIKHELKENKFLYIADNLPTDIVYIGDRRL